MCPLVFMRFTVTYFCKLQNVHNYICVCMSMYDLYGV